MVAVEVPDVGSMVHPVVGRRIKNGLEPMGQFVDQFCMHPKLVKQVDADHSKNHQRIETQER